MKHVVLLGGGRVGAAMALDLRSDFRVTVVDCDDRALDGLVAAGIGVRKADLGLSQVVKDVVGDADLVVGALPGCMGFQTLKTVLQAGKDVVDISFFEEDPFELDPLARALGLVAVVDCGVAPGCGNMILGHLETHMDRVDRWECLVGGLPQVRTWPYEYKAGFSPIDVLEEYTRPARYIAHGRLVTLPALSEPELVDLPGVGTLEAFNTDGLRTLIRTSGAPFKKEKTLRYPGHIDKMRVLRETGFLSKEPIGLCGGSVVPLDLTCRLLFPHWELKPGESDFTVMRVTVEGIEQGESRTYVFDLLDYYEEVTGISSMARTTGYSCTAAVRAVASGLFKRRGISPPEYLGTEGCWGFIREELSLRNVLFSERVSRSPHPQVMRHGGQPVAAIPPA